MAAEDTLDNVLAEFAAISKEREALDERYKVALVRLEAATLNAMRQRLQANDEGLLVAAVSTVSPEKGGNANPHERAWDWFNTVAQSAVPGAATGALVSKYRPL